MSRSPRVIEDLDNQIAHDGEMHRSDGTARLELAFDQAVSPDFSVASPGFLHTDLSWIDQALRRSWRSRPILSL